MPLHPIRSEADYDRAVAVLNALLDAGAANESHPLADLAATLGELIGDYDDKVETKHPSLKGASIMTTATTAKKATYNPIGSDFDDYLRDQGVLAKATTLSTIARAATVLGQDVQFGLSMPLPPSTSSGRTGLLKLPKKLI